MLHKVMTLKEASLIWSIPHTTIKNAATAGRLILTEINKSADTWLVSSTAMDDYYGTIVSRIEAGDHKNPSLAIDSLINDFNYTIDELLNNKCLAKYMSKEITISLDE